MHYHASEVLLSLFRLPGNTFCLSLLRKYDSFFKAQGQIKMSLPLWNSFESFWTVSITFGFLSRTICLWFYLFSFRVPFRPKCALQFGGVCMCPSSLRTDKALFGSGNFLSTQHCVLNIVLGEHLTPEEFAKWWL